MLRRLKRWMENSVLGLASLLPARLMAHLLFLLRHRPDLTDRWGYHIRAVHYYEPIPDFKRITAEQLIRRRTSPAIDFRIEEQRTLVHRLGASYRTEIAKLADGPTPEGFDFTNPYFSGLDA